MTLKILSENKEVGKAKLYDNIVLDNFFVFLLWFPWNVSFDAY